MKLANLDLDTFMSAITKVNRLMNDDVTCAELLDAAVRDTPIIDELMAEMDKLHQWLPFTNSIQRSSEGAASCRKWALRALQKNSKTRRLCWRQVAITVQTRSHQRCPRLPRVPCVI